MKRTPLRLLALLLGFVLVVAACGGDDSSSDDEDSGDDTTTTTEAEEEDEPEDTTTTTEAEEDEDEGDRDDAIGDFGDSVEDELGDVPTNEPAPAEYVNVTDDSGFLTVDVPVEWSDVDGSPGLFGPNVLASTDVQQWLQSYNVPGIWFEATDIQTGQTNDEILTAISESQGQTTACTSLGRQPYEDPAYVGVSEVFQDCAGTDTDFVWLAFSPPDNRFHGVVGVQIFSSADVDALEQALATFLVDA
jgi:serine protease Do